VVSLRDTCEKDSPGRSLVRRLCVEALLVVATVIGSSLPFAWAQDDFFKPVFEATPTIKKHEKGTAIFSFARFEPDFKGMCKGLEEDGRRERIVAIAEVGVKKEKECITCRSFWKMIVAACGKLGPRPTPTPKPKKTRRGKDAEEAETAGATQEAKPETPQVSTNEPQTGEPTNAVAVPTSATPPAATGKGRQVRYPSTEVLDEVSRVSSEIYALDSGDGQVAEMVRYFAKTVRETPGLSIVEREYYDIFLTYLLAAWSGRVDATRKPPPTPAAELDAFFE
jgi:hypothetical protein